MHVNCEDHVFQGPIQLFEGSISVTQTENEGVEETLCRKAQKGRLPTLWEETNSDQGGRREGVTAENRVYLPKLGALLRDC